MLEKKEHQYEKAVLVGLITQHQDEEKLTEYLDELEFLAFTAGATVEKRFTQKLSQPDSRTFVGSGKAEEIKNFVKENEIGTVIFDDELSPSQLKNLEKEMEVYREMRFVMKENNFTKFAKMLQANNLC